MPISASSSAELQPVPRTIIAFFDRQNESDPRFTAIHRYLEMPLNHLGFRLKYQNIHDPLPPHMPGVSGALVWLQGETSIEDYEPWLAWLHEHLDRGRKLLVIDRLGIAEKVYVEDPTVIQKINKLLARIGVRDNDQWVNITYDAEFTYKDPKIVEFERKYGGVLPPYISTAAVNGGKSYLGIKSAQFDDNRSDLIISHENGGYFSSAYSIYLQEVEGGEKYFSQWYIHPFKYLHAVFKAAPFPKPDVSTLLGKRIFYSHIDGDAWNSLSEIEKYKGTGTLASEVLYEEIFRKYPQVPFTVGLVVSELEVGCMGLPKSREVARRILQLPNVQAGSHSFSHPLMWSYFAEHNHEDEQERFASFYPSPLYDRFFLADWLKAIKIGRGGLDETLSEIYERDYPPDHLSNETDPLIGVRSAYATEEERLKEYKTPRSFNCQPFNLQREVKGSVDYINALTDGEKPVTLYQWSGNTVPFEAALAEVDKLGIGNINGGDSRFDMEFPSYTSVAPIGVEVGTQRQIYSSNSNENTYTNRWTERFFGYKFLRSTTENTGSPVRLDPINIYFHTYSAAKQASLSAVQENIDYAQTRDIIPIYASEYVAIAEGYYRTELVKLGVDGWRVMNRGALQTIRFDDATLKTVDFQRSKGVLGLFYLQGSMYVSLDPEIVEPIIFLKQKENIGGYDPAPHPYVIQSNWQIRDLQISKNLLSISASGLGEGKIVFKMPQCAPHSVEINLGKDVVIKYKETTLHDCRMMVQIPPAEGSVRLALSVADN